MSLDVIPQPPRAVRKLHIRAAQQLDSTSPSAIIHHLQVGLHAHLAIGGYVHNCLSLYHNHQSRNSSGGCRWLGNVKRTCGSMEAARGRKYVGESSARLCAFGLGDVQKWPARFWRRDCGPDMVGWVSNKVVNRYAGTESRSRRNRGSVRESEQSKQQRQRSSRAYDDAKIRANGGVFK